MPLTAISLPHSAFNIGTHKPEPLDARPFDCLTKTQAQETKPPVNLILKAIFAGPSPCLPMQTTQSLECGLCCTNRAAANLLLLLGPPLSYPSPSLPASSTPWPSIPARRSAGWFSTGCGVPGLRDYSGRVACHRPLLHPVLQTAPLSRPLSAFCVRYLHVRL